MEHALAPQDADEKIVQAARNLVERHGRDGFSMGDVAAAVGVRAPSLYGRFSDRGALLAAVGIHLLWALQRTLDDRAQRGGSLVEVKGKACSLAAPTIAPAAIGTPRKRLIPSKPGTCEPASRLVMRG